jgi:hypothetical protein
MSTTTKALTDPEPLSRRPAPEPLSQKSETDSESRKSEPDSLSRKSEPSEQQASSIPSALISMLQICSREQLQQIPGVIAQILDQRAMAGSTADLEPTIFAALTEVAKTEQTSGIIPLDKLRRQLLGVPRDALDAALMDMEERGKISLKAAKSVRASRAPDGIQSERGLLFFVVIQ